jgi:hypothetical protein
MRRRALVRSRRWLVPREEDVAEEVRHGIVDVRRGGWELLRRASAARPAERLPDRESWLVFSGNRFLLRSNISKCCKTEGSDGVGRGCRLDGLQWVDQTVQVQLISRSYKAPST